MQAVHRAHLNDPRCYYISTQPSKLLTALNGAVASAGTPIWLRELVMVFNGIVAIFSTLPNMPPMPDWPKRPPIDPATALEPWAEFVEVVVVVVEEEPV